jgi:hypothetical protein
MSKEREVFPYSWDVIAPMQKLGIIMPIILIFIALK